MGCWNKTCALTNLPIFCDEKVYVIPLLSNGLSGRGGCYTTGQWSHMGYMFESVYDDYGRGEDSNPHDLGIILDYIKTIMVDVEQGENKYHDIEVKKENLDETLFFKAVQEGRLLYQNRLYQHEEPLPISYVMMKKSAVDGILQNHSIEIYSEGKFRDFSFNEIFNDIPKFIEAYKERIYAVDEDDTRGKIRLSFMGLSSQSAQEEINYKGPLWSMLHHQSMYDRMPEKIIMDRAIDDGFMGVQKIMENMVRFKFIDLTMDSLRKHWVPMAHEGSQAVDMQPYKTFMKVMQEEIDRCEHRWDEDDDEY